LKGSIENKSKFNKKIKKNGIKLKKNTINLDWGVKFKTNKNYTKKLKKSEIKRISTKINK